MAKFKDTEIGGYYEFKCPGCGISHFVNCNPTVSSVTWQFNGNLNKPTVSPSVLVEYTWGPQKEYHRCHSFVRNGEIQFLNDCTHKLAGKTVELPEIKV